MAFCLPKNLAGEFIKRLKSGEINPEKLSSMTSEERRNFFSSFVDAENAKNVNALFESKLLLKNQQKGIINWAKQVANLKPEVEKDIVARVQKMENVLSPQEEEAFLSDLAEHKLGFGVTLEESTEIFNLAKDVKTKKDLIDRKSENGSDSRMEYGTALVEFHEYVNNLKLKAAKKTFKEFIRPWNLISEISSVSKSLLASLDNSFYGRQGIKVLFTKPNVWAKDFYKSWGDIAKALKGQNPVNVIKADVMSRENALNGKYKKGKYDLGISGEEAFPSSLPERIPLLGRLFKASEAAFNGGALRMRADLADVVIRNAEQVGVDTNNREQAEDLGKIVNALTGRGGIGRLESVAKEVNILLFSVKFLKSQIDTLVQPFSLDTAYARKEARKNLLKIVGSIAFIMSVANFLDDDSVEFDPRSSDFGKIKVGNTKFDISGGMSALVVLASRLVPTYHNGDWSFWQKNSKGEFVDLVSGKYGQDTALDVFENFWEGKLSPFAGVIRDAWKGEDYQGNKTTPSNVLKNLTIPIPVKTYMQLKSDPDSANVLASMILEFLGIGTSNATPRKKSGRESKRPKKSNR